MPYVNKSYPNANLGCKSFANIVDLYAARANNTGRI